MTDHSDEEEGSYWIVINPDHAGKLARRVPLMNGLVEYFVSRNIFVNLLTFILIAVGGYTAATMNREAFPNIDFDIVIVTTIYPGASPQEVEKLVSIPLEEAIKEVDGIKEYGSYSLENRSGLVITIDPDEDDAQGVVDDIRAAVDRVNDLPEDAETPLVSEIGTKQSPVIEVGVARKRQADGSYTVTEKELRDYAERLEDRILELDGVARISRNGWRDREIHVDVNPNLLDYNYLSIEQVIGAIQKRNVNFPGGNIETPVKEMVIRTIGEYEGASEVARTFVRSNDMGQAILVKDVAKVEEDFVEADTLEKVRGNPSISLVVLKREHADIITLVDQIKELVDVYKKETPPGIEISYVNDVSYFIRRRLGVLFSNGITGLLLVVTSLFFFMGWRTSLMVALGIPVAMGMTFIIMSYMGVTLNLISMFGLILVIGILVDDAIIVSENFYRFYEEGHSAYDAAVMGTGQVIAPIIATVSTTIAAFGPLMFMTGIFGKFIYTIPLVIIIALLSSLFESFFILPSHLFDANKYSKHKKGGEIKEESGWFFSFRKKIYIPLLKIGLRHPVIVMLLMTVILVGAGLAQKHFGRFVLFPDAIETFHVKMEAPQGVSKEYMELFTRAVENEVAKLSPEELDTYTARVGIMQKNVNDPQTKRGSNYAQLMVYLTPETERERKAGAIIQEIRQKVEWLLNPRALEKQREKELSLGQVVDENIEYDIPPEYEQLKGKLDTLDFEKLKGGPPVGKPVAIEIMGNDFETLNKIADEYKAILETIPGIVDIDDDFDDGKDEIQVRVNESLASQVGVSVTQIAIAINAAFQGNVPTSIKRAEEEVDIRIRFEEKYRNRVKDVNRISVMNQTGKLIPIQGLLSSRDTKGITMINHKDGKRIVTVSTNLDEKILTSSEAAKMIAEAAKAIPPKYPAYQINFGGENEDTQESMQSLMRAFLVGLFIVFMILASLFRSLIQPVVVMAAIPFSLIGVIFAFLTHGHPLSFMSIMGIIGLSGVVVNDSIILVDFANRIKEENPEMPLEDVVSQAAEMRIRAVLLTTITTVLGLLPTAYGIGGFDPFLIPMALAFSWGLMFATVLTLGVVPIQYLLVEKAKNRIGRMLGVRLGHVGHDE